MNAYTEVMRAELVDAIGHAEADDDVRAIIVTGAEGFLCRHGLGDAGATFDYTSVAQDEHRDGGGYWPCAYTGAPSR
jgi:enoyl-CoA hydratase/carnithine racemase